MIPFPGFIGVNRSFSPAAGGGAPVNLTPPVASGTGYNGRTLTTTNGTWANSPTGFTYQWQSNESNISGATSSTYVVTAFTEGTSLTCVVTASNVAGLSNATSNAIHNFVPTDAGNLGAWFDAYDASTVSLVSGNQVTQWNDKSGNNRHVSPPLATNRPSYQTTGLNSRPTMQVDGDDYLERTTGLSGLLQNVGGGTMGFVGRYASSGIYDNNISTIFVSIGDNDSRARFLLSSNSSAGATPDDLACSGRRLDTDSYQGVSSSTSRASVAGSPLIEIGTLTYSEAVANHYTNGTQDLINAPFQTAGNTSNTAPLALRIMALTSANRLPSGCQISDIIIYNQTLSLSNRQKLEGYFAHKWFGSGALNTLPSGHPYKTTPPTP